MQSKLLRLLALVPIPVVVLLVVWAGNRPLPPPPKLDQADATKAKGGGAAAGLKLPRELGGGWAVRGKIERYDKKTLFDRIDGAAPAYIRAGFEYSLGLELAKGAMKEGIVADLYAMGSVARALGMYATERDPSYTFIKVGDGGYVAAGSLNFWRGPFYVKLAGFDDNDEMERALKDVATRLAAKLPSGSEQQRAALLPLSWFPAEGRLPNTQGYSHPPLGDIAGLEQVYTTSYAGKEQQDRVRLFLGIATDAAAAESRLGKVKDYFTKDGGKASTNEVEGVSLLQLQTEDTRTLVATSGKVLAGAVDLTSAANVPLAQQRILALLRAAGGTADGGTEKKK